ncbi:MAG: SMI1/KNR4 family protein [Candidatus Kapabacteria bacterium]|nr:SMI1/KNR4 family protein [Candidatus Kapabacteria bacterium]
MIAFSNVEASINNENIEEIEISVGLQFPQEYKDHLLKYNGGQCEPNMFSFYENNHLTSSCVDWFLAIYDGEFDNLKWYINLYKVKEKRMPFHIIPIAHDPGGNLICISCNGYDYGKIYFWDHEKEVDYLIEGDDNYSNLYLIANNLADFFNGLHTLDE